MDQRTNRTFICSVLYTDIVGYSKTSVEEQISLKERFNTLLSEILRDIAINDRIILDTGDGVPPSNSWEIPKMRFSSPWSCGIRYRSNR